MAVQPYKDRLGLFLEYLQESFGSVFKNLKLVTANPGRKKETPGA
jgi:hypothetical protein